MRWRRALAVVPLAAAGVLAVVVAGTSASAAGCAATVTVTRPTLAVQLQPSHVTVERGACVAFVNDAGTVVEVTVSPDYDERVAAGDRVVYAARRTGTHDMRADDGITHDDGTVTVHAPSPSPTPSSRSPRPPPNSSPPPSSPPSTAPPPTGSETGPKVAPSPSHPRHRPGHPRPQPTPAVTSHPPAPSPTASRPPVATGPIEPPTGRDSGLPGAVAALAIVGVGGAFVRVLMAQPVD